MDFWFLELTHQRLSCLGHWPYTKERATAHMAIPFLDHRYTACFSVMYAMSDLSAGSVSMAWSVFVWFMLPGTPMEAKFLSKQEKYHTVVRTASNQTGIENREWKWDQVREAVIDPKTWILFFFDISINVSTTKSLLAETDCVLQDTKWRSPNLRLNHHQRSRLYFLERIPAFNAHRHDVDGSIRHIFTAGREMVEPPFTRYNDSVLRSYHWDCSCLWITTQ